MPVRVLHRHARLPRAPKTAQHRQPRSWRPRAAARQPGVQVRQQPLAARQDRRTRRQPHRQARRLRPPLVFNLADRHAAPVGSPPTRALAQSAGCGYDLAGPGPVGFRRRHIPMDHPGGDPAARRGDVHIPSGRHRMIRRRHRPGGQLGRDVLHQRAQLCLHTGILVKQVSETARPPLRRGLPRPLRTGPRRRDQILLRLRQPLLRDLGLAGITAAKQPREPVPDRLPHISDRRGRDRLTRELRQRHQHITRHPATPFST